MIGNSLGKLGEDIAEKYLKNKGFSIIERNYWKPYGEIDIVAEKGGKLHFVEVKAISTTNIGHGEESSVSREPSRAIGDSYNPAQNVHYGKLKKLSRVIRSYLMKKSCSGKDWQFDICIVKIDKEGKRARVNIIQDEILPE